MLYVAFGHLLRIFLQLPPPCNPLSRCWGVKQKGCDPTGWVSLQHGLSTQTHRVKALLCSQQTQNWHVCTSNPKTAVEETAVSTGCNIMWRCLFWTISVFLLSVRSCECAQSLAVSTQDYPHTGSSLKGHSTDLHINLYWKWVIFVVKM